MTPDSLHDLGRLWRTVRWLRREQVLGRARLWLAPMPRVDGSAPPAMRAAIGPWATPPARAASLVGPGCWRLLAREHELDAIGWDDPAVDLLWRYNQHYFDDLNAQGAAARREWQRALVERWIRDNPPGRGTAWAPYPTSLRIVNWIKWFLGGETPHPQWLASLATQTRWLAQRIEWHLLGNHLFANAKALVFAGSFFEAREANEWRTVGWRILERELHEQFLADGAQFERSPMYHALALEDVLDLINLAQAFGPTDAQIDGLRELAGRMSGWLQSMLHPLRAMARFNDCAEGIAPPIDELESYAAQLGIAAPPAPGEGVHAMRPSGYVRVRRGRCTALLDIAPIGPDYLPGHAHADTLSFELSLGTREIVVNRGTSVYGSGERRQTERGTAAHSTVQVGDQDSSEVWAGFRVGRRARPSPIAIDGWTVGGSHDGYAHLPGRPIHHRQWHFDERSVSIDDRIDPAAPSIARFHLAPGLSLHPQTADQWLVLEGETTLAQMQVERGHASTEAWQHAHAFGDLCDAVTLTVALDQGRSIVRLSWGDR